MAVINIGSFSGLSAKISPKLLQENQAQVATNCLLENGQLRPMKDTEYSTLVSSMTVVGYSSFIHLGSTVAAGGDLGLTAQAHICGDVVFFKESAADAGANYICIQAHTSDLFLAGAHTNWPTDAGAAAYWLPIYVYVITDARGTHTGPDNSASLYDTAANGGDLWVADELIARKLYNTGTTGTPKTSNTIVTDNSTTECTGTLSAGDWDIGDRYYFEGLVETSAITCGTVAAGGLDVSGEAKYITLHTPDVGVYIWFNVTGGSNSQEDPALTQTSLATYAGIQIDVASGGNAAVVATALAHATTGAGKHASGTDWRGLWSSVTNSSPTVTFVNKYTGVVTDIDATNCTGTGWSVAAGSAGSTEGVDSINLIVGGSVESIYKLNSSWLQFSEEVDVVPSSVPDNDYRVYITGDQYPKQTDHAIATSGDAYTWPTTYYRLGVPAPATAPTATAHEGAGGTIDTDFTTAYVYTYVTDWGEEGAPSPPSNTETVVAANATHVDIGNITSPTGLNTNVISVRLYRVNVGDETGEYQFVSETTLSTAVASDIEDNVNAFDLGEVIVTDDFDNPPDNLTGIIQYSNGMYCAYVNNDIYFNEPFYPYAWPDKYRNNLPQTVKGLGSIGGSVVVTTDGHPTLLSGSHPANMLATTLPYNKPNTNARSIVSSKFGVTYSSPEGLFQITNETGTLLTEKVFSEAQWQTYDIYNMIGVFHNNKYYGIFKGASTGIIYDYNMPDAITTFDITGYRFKYGYTDGTDLYVLVTNISTGEDEVHTFESASTSLTYTWRSKIFQQLELRSLSACRILGVGTTTLKMYINGDWSTPVFTKSDVTLDALFRLPGKRAKEVMVELTGTGYIDFVQLASSVKELG